LSVRYLTLFAALCKAFPSSGRRIDTSTVPLTVAVTIPYGNILGVLDADNPDRLKD